MKTKKFYIIHLMIVFFVLVFLITMLALDTFKTNQNIYAVENQNIIPTEEMDPSTVLSNGPIAENKNDIGTKLNSDNKESLSDIKCIGNVNYFLMNPLHGKNNGSYNENGTCTTVAMQMLMGYHNYYSDRRLIPETAGEVRFLNENYGKSFYSDPVNYYENTQWGRGASSIGTEDGFYETLINYTHNKLFDTYPQTIRAVTDAANSFVADYARELKSSVTITYSISYNKENVVDELNAGRPIVIGYEPILTGAKNWHVAVAFGYANYKGEFGYLVHSGWQNSLFYWVPAKWIGYQIRMTVDHEHEFWPTVNYYQNEYSELFCSQCSCYKYSKIFSVNDTGEKITGLTEPITGTLTIPEYFEDNRITGIEPGAFIRNQTIGFINMSSSIKNIGAFAFSESTSLGIKFPENTELESIGSWAFFKADMADFNFPSSVTTIDPFAFSKANLNSFFHLPSYSKLKDISSYAFGGNPGIESFILPQSISEIGTGIFNNCPNVTIYTDCYSQPAGWNKNWNEQNRPVVWGCSLSGDKSYVTSFYKSSTFVSNPEAENGISNPFREDYHFGGWYTNSNFTGTKYMNIKDAPNGDLYVKWDKTCVSEGTLITLADGTQKAVETLTGNEQLLVWNLLTGTFDTAPILFIDHDEAFNYEVINLTFSDGTTVKVISEHGFFDFDLNEYVFLRRDAAKYIGHWFNKQTMDSKGNMFWTKVQLESVDVRQEYTTAWSPVTYGHLCYYVNGMLSMPGATEGLINIFDVDPMTMKIDEEAYAADIAKYGLFTYEEFAELYPVPEVIFEAFGGQYLKVAMGKGLLTDDMLKSLIARYSVFFEGQA